MLAALTCAPLIAAPGRVPAARDGLGGPLRGLRVARLKSGGPSIGRWICCEAQTDHTHPGAPAREDPALLEAACDAVSCALCDGDLVGIFPERRITYTGELSPFRGGVRRIVETTPMPVVPMTLRGLWGSMFSRKGGRAFFKRPRPFSLVELVVGAPVPP
jgi:hypothetical protein